jgi:hypothetical protein
MYLLTRQKYQGENVKFPSANQWGEIDDVSHVVASFSLPFSLPEKVPE